MTKTSTDAQIVGSVSFINGDAQQFTDATAYLDRIREELPYRATSGFSFRTVTQDPAIRKAYTACAWNGPARTNLNPVQEVDAAVKRVDAGFSTAQEETATMTGGDYNRNIRQRVIEAKRKREVDEITNPQAKPPGGQQEE